MVISLLFFPIYLFVLSNHKQNHKFPPPLCSDAKFTYGSAIIARWDLSSLYSIRFENSNGHRFILSIFRRSASPASGPIDLLMDHELDFIEGQITWKWCLLAMSGNATIVKLRRNDFVKYLKMNVASLVGSEYDFVRVTSISYTPYVLVNVSLDWNEANEPRIIKSLGNLASHNDTLLDLSGEHFNLTDFLPASSLLSPKALSPLEERDAAAAAKHPRQVKISRQSFNRSCGSYRER